MRGTALKVSLAALTADIWGPVVWYCTAHCQVTVVVPHRLWLQTALYIGPGVVSEVSPAETLNVFVGMACPFVVPYFLARMIHMQYA